MAINQFVRAALKMITALDIDVKKTYKVERQAELFVARMRGKPSDFTIWDQEVICDRHQVPVRLFVPNEKGPFPLLLFIHGGGWVMGGIENYTAMCAELAKATRHMVASVDYRLAPEHKFPVAAEDCYAVAKAFYTGNVVNVRQDAITLVGDSAGGNLAAAVSLMARDRGEFLPERQILFYPVLADDHTDASPYPSIHENGTDYLLTSRRVQRMMEMYTGGPEDWKSPYFAPLLEQDLSNQPDTLMITAEFCPLRDEGEDYALRLRRAGNQTSYYCMRDALHAFMMLPPRYIHVKRAHQVVNEFLQRSCLG